MTGINRYKYLRTRLARLPEAGQNMSLGHDDLCALAFMVHLACVHAGYADNERAMLSDDLTARTAHRTPDCLAAHVARHAAEVVQELDGMLVDTSDGHFEQAWDYLYSLAGEPRLQVRAWALAGIPASRETRP